MIQLENFVNLRLEISSNSEAFLKLFKRTFGMFFIPEVRSYYSNIFKIIRTASLDVIFDKKKEAEYINALTDIERHIKYLLWGRFVILHASCVRYNNYNLFFVGEAKSGKSTICSGVWGLGGRVLSEDYSLLDAKTKEACIFPTIGTIRSGIKTGIQQKYQKHFKKYESAGLTEKLISMKEAEYKSLLDYHKKLYRSDEGLMETDFTRNKNIFILLRNNTRNSQGSKRILARKRAIDVLPELMKNIAANYKYGSQLIKENMSLFLRSECYVLERAPLDLMLSAVYSRFSQVESEQNPPEYSCLRHEIGVID